MPETRDEAREQELAQEGARALARTFHRILNEALMDANPDKINMALYYVMRETSRRDTQFAILAPLMHVEDEVAENLWGFYNEVKQEETQDFIEQCREYEGFDSVEELIEDNDQRLREEGFEFDQSAAPA